MKKNRLGFLVLLILIFSLGQFLFRLWPLLNEQIPVDFSVYYRAAQLLQQGKNLYNSNFYQPGMAFLYSPAAMIFLWWLAFLNLELAAKLFTIISFLFLFFSLALLSKLIFKKNIKLVVVILLTFIVQTFPIKLNFTLGQINIFVLFFFIGFLFFYQQKKKILAAISLALSVAIKPFALLILPLLITKKQWRILKVFFLTLLATNLLFFKQVCFYLNQNWLTNPLLITAIKNKPSFYDQSFLALLYNLDLNTYAATVLNYALLSVTIFLLLLNQKSRKFSIKHASFLLALAVVFMSDKAWQHQLILVYPFILLNFSWHIWLLSWLVFFLHFPTENYWLLQLQSWLANFQTVYLLILFLKKLWSSIKKINQQNKLLILLLIIFFSRLIFLPQEILQGDFARDWQIVAEFISGKKFILLGPSASFNPQLRLGPFYYYLLSIAYLIGDGNSLVANLLMLILNTAGLYVYYLLLKKILPRALLWPSYLIYAFSFFIARIQVGAWNPLLIPTIVICLLYLLITIKQQSNYKLIPSVFLLLAIALQFHAVMIFFLAVILLFLPKNKISLNYWLVGIVFALLIFVPWFIADFSSDHLQIKLLGESLASNKATSSCNFIWWLQHHGQGESCFAFIRNPLFIFKQFSRLLLNSQNFIIAILVGVSSTAALIFNKKIKFKKIILASLFTPMLCFALYKGNVYDHYFLMFLPLVPVGFVLLLDLIACIFKSRESQTVSCKNDFILNLPKIFIWLITIVILIYNLQHYWPFLLR